MATREIQAAISKAASDFAIYASLMGPPFEMPPHIELLINELELVERGMTDRLMIYMPPRHGKSVTASTLFPAWFLGRHPDKSVIAASYGAELALDFGRRTRNFVADPLHTTTFPKCTLAGDSSAVHRFALSAGGNYFAVGAGGPLTGRGADLLLIDDPIKSREEAYSQATRKSLQQWFESVAYTRLQPGAAIILIQTRWHQDDLAGWLLREHASEGWRVISLPALAETKDLLDRFEGDALWPQKFPLETLNRIREAIGSQAWISQYQQRPAPEEGAIFKKDWFLSYAASDPPECSQIVMSLDTAFKTGESNDYSVIQIWGQMKNGFALLTQWRERKEFPDLMRQAIAMGEKFSPHYVLVEDAASGQSLIQALQKETRLPILPCKPMGDKLARASAVSPLAEAGKIFLPDQAPWLRDFLDEVTSFPAAPHDDQVDALSQALNYMREAPYEPFRYSGLPRYERQLFGGRAAGFTTRGGPEEDDAREDLIEGHRGGTFIHSAEQMRALSEYYGRDRIRWPTFSRRRAW